MNATEAALWIDPARMSGAVCLTGTRIDVATVANQVAHDGVDFFMEGYDITDRRQVLIACAWYYANGSFPDKPTRTWAKDSWKLLAQCYDDPTAATVPDPPSPHWPHSEP